MTDHRNPFIDDAAEEDDDDDEEEDEDSEAGDRRRQRKRQRNRYIDEEAVVDDEDEDLDEDDDSLLQEDGFIADDVPDDERDAARREADRQNRRLDQLRRVQEDKSAEEMAAELNERYARNKLTQESDYTEVPQRMLMPSVEDPNIWSVRCKQGRERSIVMTIMLKAVQASFTTKPVRITSAFVRDSIPGRLFVEARRFDHIVDALRDINGVYASNAANIFLVPIEEMADLLKITKKSQEIKPGGWVRIKRGRYAGDLAQVIDETENGEEVGIRFVPRIDLNPKEEGTYTDASGRKRKKGAVPGSAALSFRPPPRFFNYEEVMRAYKQRPPMPRGLGRYLFMGDEYANGYCEKDVRRTGLILEGVNPTLDEVSKFMGESGADGIENANVDLNLLAEATKKDDDVLFQPGDHVEVFEGEQAGVRGAVVSIDAQGVTLEMEGEGLVGQKVEVPIKSIRKRFKPGDHIKVISGKHADETGLVVKIEDNITTFLSDLSLAEVSVFSKDIREAAEVGSGVNVIGGYELYDLVQLDASTAGVIFKIERELFQVLDQSGQIVHVQPHQISGKRDSTRAVALDSNGTEMRRGDAVRELDGERRDGQILHIYQSTVVFLHNRDVTENGGVFIGRPRNLAPKFQVGKPSTDASKMNPQRKGDASAAANPIAGMQGRGRDPLKGKYIAITRGPYKTYRGIVKETLGTTARVELQSIAKTVTVDVASMVEKDPHTGASRPLMGVGAGGFRGTTPGGRSTAGSAYGGGTANGGRPNAYASSMLYGAAVNPPPQTPAPLGAGGGPGGGITPATGMWGSRTPAHVGAGNATPGYQLPGNATPAYAMGNRTPAYAGADARTPAYGGAARTPAYAGSARTPNHAGLAGGAKTPNAYASSQTPNPYGDDAGRRVRSGLASQCVCPFWSLTVSLLSCRTMPTRHMEDQPRLRTHSRRLTARRHLAHSLRLLQRPVLTAPRRPRTCTATQPRPRMLTATRHRRRTPAEPATRSLSATKVSRLPLAFGGCVLTSATLSRRRGRLACPGRSLPLRSRWAREIIQKRSIGWRGGLGQRCRRAGCGLHGLVGQRRAHLRRAIWQPGAKTAARRPAQSHSRRPAPRDSCGPQELRRQHWRSAGPSGGSSGNYRLASFGTLRLVDATCIRTS